MHFQGLLCAFALLAIGGTTPTPATSASTVNCSAIHQFYIQSQGGQKNGYYGQINAEQQMIYYNQRTTKNATRWSINERKYLVVEASTPGASPGTVASMFRRAYQDFFISIVPTSSLHGQPADNRVVPVLCSIGAETNGTCPLQCQATIKDGVLFNYEYSYQGGSGVPAIAELGIENADDRFAERIQMLAVPHLL